MSKIFIVSSSIIIILFTFVFDANAVQTTTDTSVAPQGVPTSSSVPVSTEGILPSSSSVNNTAAAPYQKTTLPVMTRSVKYSRGIKHVNDDPQKFLTVEDIGIWGGNMSVWYGVLTENGKIVGNLNSIEDGRMYPFKWENGQIKQLVGVSDIIDMNNRGQILEIDSIFENGRSIQLGTLGGFSTSATDINDSGKVVGESDIASERVEQHSHAFLWDGRMHHLDTLGGNSSIANAINNRNQIVGTARTADDIFYPVLWENGRITNIGNYGNIKMGTAVAINERGQVIGQATFEDGTNEAFVWDGGSIKRLRSFKEGYWPVAVSINDRGDIAGYIQTGILYEEDYSGIVREKWWPSVEMGRAVIWKNGELIDLNDLLPNNSGIKLFQAVRINNRGQVIAQGVTKERDDYHIFLLTLPENIAPNMEIISPDEEIFIPNDSVLQTNQPGVIQNTVTITWRDVDPDNNARISLYYYRDNPRIEDTGQLIATFRENRDKSGDRYVWNIVGFSPGLIYIYAVIDDGVNPPLTVFSKQLERFFETQYQFPTL